MQSILLNFKLNFVCHEIHELNKLSKFELKNFYANFNPTDSNKIETPTVYIDNKVLVGEKDIVEYLNSPECIHT